MTSKRNDVVTEQLVCLTQQVKEINFQLPGGIILPILTEKIQRYRFLSRMLGIYTGDDLTTINLSEVSRLFIDYSEFELTIKEFTIIKLWIEKERFIFYKDDDLDRMMFKCILIGLDDLVEIISEKIDRDKNYNPMIPEQDSLKMYKWHIIRHNVLDITEKKYNKTFSITKKVEPGSNDYFGRRPINLDNPLIAWN
jgi:hypothetical protein